MVLFLAERVTQLETVEFNDEKRLSIRVAASPPI